MINTKVKDYLQYYNYASKKYILTYVNVTIMDRWLNYYKNHVLMEKHMLIYYLYPRGGGTRMIYEYHARKWIYKHPLSVET